MNGSMDDYFDEPLRDQWKRPLLIPAGGSEADRTAYTRASSLSDHVHDFAGLHLWQQRNLARGIGRREDLAALAAAVPLEHPTDRAANQRANRDLDDVIRQAFEASGAAGGRNYGTAFHSFTEPGAATGYAPDRMQADIASLEACMRRYRMRIGATEVFVANDALRSAGTFDHLIHIDGFGWVVADKKTEREPHPGKWGVQIFVYATADVYDWTDDSRAPLESLTGGEVVRRDWGLVLHTPKETGHTEAIMVPLEPGGRGGALAIAVREWRKETKRLMTPLDDLLGDQDSSTVTRLVERLERATSRTEINAIMNGASDTDRADASVRDAANTRWKAVKQ